MLLFQNSHHSSSPEMNSSSTQKSEAPTCIPGNEAELNLVNTVLDYHSKQIEYAIAEAIDTNTLLRTALGLDPIEPMGQPLRKELSNYVNKTFSGTFSASYTALRSCVNQYDEMNSAFTAQCSVLCVAYAILSLVPFLRDLNFSSIYDFVVAVTYFFGFMMLFNAILKAT
jgi:hypothetical protein